jgi:hypothetical protein
MQTPQGRGAVRPPLGVAFEGDIGHRLDAALAYAMLQGLAAKGEARAVAFCISRSNLKTAQLADVFAGLYVARPVGGSAMIGMPESPRSDEVPPLAEILGRRNAEGAPIYTSNIKTVIDTADNAVLFRNIILAQHDQNAALVVAGPASGLVRMAGLYGARPQITAKVKHLVLAAGAFAGSTIDPSVKLDVAAARKLFAEWPTPIVVVGAEVGEALPYPGVSIDRDFLWSPTHPIAEVYRTFKPMPYDAPAPALAAALYAVHPDDGYFKLSEPGTITVGDDGRTSFAASAAGRHRYLIADPAQKERVLKLYTDLVSSRPPARGGGRGRGAPLPPPNQLPPANTPPAAGRGAPPAAPTPSTPPTP